MPQQGNDGDGPAAIAMSILTSAEITRLASAHYKLAPVTACRLLCGGYNDVYRIDCDDRTRWVARLSGRRPRGPANIDYEVSMLEHIASRGTAVVEPLRTRSGAAGVTIAAPEGARCLALFRYLDGETYDDLGESETVQCIELTGAGLARLHEASIDYDGPRSLYRLDVHHLLHEPLVRLLQAPTMDEDLRMRFKALAAAFELDEATLAQLSEVACHGDCHGGNNFMTKNSAGQYETTFFDFDDAGPGYLAYELAVFHWDLLSGRASLSDGGTRHWDAFLAGYCRRGALSAEDVAAIPSFIGMRHVLWMGEHAGRQDQWGSMTLPRKWLRRQCELMEAWRALDLSLPALSDDA